jgi:hypothetical protein
LSPHSTIVGGVPRTIFCLDLQLGVESLSLGYVLVSVI